MRTSEITGKSYDSPLLGICLTVAASLFALYFVFLAYFAPTIASLSNAVEIIIFYTLVIRVLLLSCVPRLRRLPGQIKIGILAVESFLLILVIVLFIITGDGGYNALMGLILTAWIAAGLVVITPYSISEFVINMYKSKTITNVLVMLAGEFATVVFLSNIAFQISPPPVSLSKLGIDLLSAVRLQPGGGITGFSPSNLTIDVIALIIYFCMIVYVVRQHGVPGRGKELPFLLMLLGTLALFSWSSVAIFTNLDIFIALSAPAIGIPLAFMVILRGKTK